MRRQIAKLTGAAQGPYDGRTARASRDPPKSNARTHALGTKCTRKAFDFAVRTPTYLAGHTGVGVGVGQVALRDPPPAHACVSAVYRICTRVCQHIAHMHTRVSAPHTACADACVSAPVRLCTRVCQCRVPYRTRTRCAGHTAHTACAHALAASVPPRRIGCYSTELCYISTGQRVGFA
eukprot:3756646-Rhodomonas_salina.1